MDDKFAYRTCTLWVTVHAQSHQEQIPWSHIAGGGGHGGWCWAWGKWLLPQHLTQVTYKCIQKPSGENWKRKLKTSAYFVFVGGCSKCRGILPEGTFGQNNFHQTLSFLIRSFDWQVTQKSSTYITTVSLCGRVHGECMELQCWVYSSVLVMCLNWSRSW